MSSMYPPTPRFKPAEKDIIGQWHLNEGSKNRIINDGYEISDSVIDIKPDGTVIITNYPQYYGFGSPRWEIYSGSGKWRIEKDRNRDWSIRIDFVEKNGYPYNKFTYFYLSGKRPPYVIFDYVGDPDSMITIAFEKE